MQPIPRHPLAALVALLLVTTAPGSRVLAQPGALDPTFGTDGTARIGFGDGGDASYALAVHPNGNYLVAGRVGAYLAVAGYLSNGIPDLTFGQQGATRLGDRSGSGARAVAVQPDGRIVVAGYDDQGALVTRFLANGALDTSFGVNGFADMPGTTGFTATALVMQGSQILVAGTFDAAMTNSRFGLCRLTSGGLLDPSFDADGIQSTTLPNGGAANGMTLQPDGKIVLVGYARNSPSGYSMALVRYDANGALDTSFDGDGRVITTVGGATGVTIGHAVIPQVLSGGATTLLVAGRTGSANPGGDGLLARYSLNGTLDPVFGSGGVVVQNVSSGTDEFRAVRFVAGTTHENPSRIFVGGFTTSPTTSRDALLCSYTVSGTLNTGFGGGDGIASTNIGNGQDELWAMLLLGDRLLATGYGYNGEEGQNFMLARFLASTGALDPGFDGDGILLDDIADSEALALALARQADGRVVVVGGSRGLYEQALARLKPDGSLDSTFSGDGRTTIATGGSISYLADVALQADQRIVVAGAGLWTNVFRLTLARCLPNGSLDATFNGTGLLIVPPVGADEGAPTLAVQPDGRLLLAGTTDVLVNSQTHTLIRVSRFLANGLADPSFGGGGTVILDAGGTDAGGPQLALLADGRLLIAGWRVRYVAQLAISEIFALRLTPSGALDPTFGSGGVAVPALPDGNRTPTDLLLQPDGRLVLVGSDYISATNRNPWALRLTDAGQLDPTFGVQGYQVVSASPVDERIEAAALQPDGRLLLVGRTGTDYVNDQFMARLTVTGALDPSFSGDGLAALDLGPGGGDEAYAVLADDPARLLVAGSSRGLMCVAGVQPGSAQTGVADPPGTAPPALAVGQPWPSPTRSGMSLAVRVAEPMAVTVDVLDVSGRLVRSLGSGAHFVSGDQRIAWDGRDARGTIVAAGHYFVRVRAGDDVVIRRVVVAR